MHINVNNSKSSVSSSSSRSKSKSSLHVANPSTDAYSDPWETYKPPLPDSPDSSSSSIVEPITPDSTPEKVSKSSKHSKHSPLPEKSPRERGLPLDSGKVTEILRVSPPVDSPPAYTPNPKPTELVAVKASPKTDDVKVVLSPEGITLTSSDGSSTGAGEPQRPPIATSSSAPETREAARESPPSRAASIPVGFPTSTPSTSASNSEQAQTVQAPGEIKKQRSRKPSIVAAPSNLDKIEEMDENDPLGFTWHLGDPYEAVMKPKKKDGNAGKEGNGENKGAKIFVSLVYNVMRDFNR